MRRLLVSLKWFLGKQRRGHAGHLVAAAHGGSAAANGA